VQSIGTLLFILLIMLLGITLFDECKPTDKTTTLWEVKVVVNDITPEAMLNWQPSFPLDEFRGQSSGIFFAFQDKNDESQWAFGFLGRLAENHKQALLMIIVSESALEDIAVGEQVRFYGSPQNFTISKTSFVRSLEGLKIGDQLEVVILEKSRFLGLWNDDSWHLYTTSYPETEE